MVDGGSRYRKNTETYIRINNKDVCRTCDYSGLHVNMLYGKEGLPMPEDGRVRA